MSEHAVLGPIDPQVNGMPAASIIRVKSEKSLNRIDDETLIYADVAAKAIDQLKRATVELLSGHMDAEAANKVADELTSGRWTHDYPITAGEARAFGLAVSTDMPKDVLDLLQLYPRAVRQQPGVESGPYREPLPRNPAGLR
jgi:ClpP class serine protease